MRILLVSGDFVKTGGMDRANYALASYLARRGDEVHLASHRVADDLLARPNVTLHRAAKPLNSYSAGNQVLRRVARRCAAEVAAGGGRVLVNGGNCDWNDMNWVHYVHAAHPPSSERPMGRLKAWLDHRMYVAEERAIVPKGRAILTTCEHARHDVLEHIPGTSPQAIHVVHLGIDPEIFYPASREERAATREQLGWSVERPKVAFIGGLSTRRKGFDTLFEAWRRLCRNPRWDADLVVIGEGSELPAWRLRVRDAGLAERILLLGFRRDVPQLLRACDAHALPSRYESYSMVTHEALCCGLPAFVSASAGIADRYPLALKPLLLPDPEDSSDLAARLTLWRDRLDQPWPELAAFAAQLRSHTWDHMAERIVAIAEQTAEK